MHNTTTIRCVHDARLVRLRRPQKKIEIKTHHCKIKKNKEHKKQIDFGFWFNSNPSARLGWERMETQLLFFNFILHLLGKQA